MATLNTRRGRFIIKSFEAQALKRRPLGVRIADYLSTFFGSVLFLVGNIIIFALWLIINSGKMSIIPVFDPPPFILLTMLVSLEAIMLSIIVLMSQNRQSFISTLRQEIDMQVNLLAEREISKILEMTKLILEKEKGKVSDPELEEMVKETDVSYIERQLEKQLSSASAGPGTVIKEIGKEIGRAAKDIGSPKTS